MGQSKRDKRRAAAQAARAIFGDDAGMSRATAYVTPTTELSRTPERDRVTMRTDDRRRANRADRYAARAALNAGRWER
jgi:hypothetical protein